MPLLLGPSATLISARTCPSKRPAPHHMLFRVLSTMAVVVPGFEEHEWAEDELQVLTDRGLTTIATHLDRFGRVRVAVDQNEQRWALKAVDYGSSELGHIQRLLDDPSPLNHTIPASLVPCKNAVIILMPRLHEVCEMKWQSLHEILECIGQMIEGALYMQDEMLSHFDIHAENIVYARLHRTENPKIPLPVTHGRFYFIDFGASRLCPTPPGGAFRVTDFMQCGGHYRPPEGTDEVDPYAYDVYCVGRTIASVCGQPANRRKKINIPPSVMRFADSLMAADPWNRPPLRKAGRVFGVLRAWIRTTHWLSRFLPHNITNSIDLFGWKIMSGFTWLGLFG